MQHQFVGALDLLIIQIPGIGKRTVIIGINDHFQVYRLFSRRADGDILDILIFSFHIGIQIVFYINVEINAGNVIILVTNLKIIISIFRDRLGNQGS